MPNVNPYKPGDDIFEQYSLTRTQKVATGVAITKGHLYTKNATGFLIAITASSAAIVAATKGMFQAKVGVAAKTYTNAVDAPKVQCLIKGSWMILKAPANVIEGDKVNISIGTGTTVVPDKVEVSNVVPGIDFIGVVHQLLTLDSDEEPKLVTENDDLVVVQSGVY